MGAGKADIPDIHKTSKPRLTGRPGRGVPLTAQGTPYPEQVSSERTCLSSQMTLLDATFSSVWNHVNYSDWLHWGPVS